jgi:hypothetical protein
MKAEEYLKELNAHFTYLYAFSRQINEFDFAASLSGEFRGSQDAGWATTITANEVFAEITALLQEGQDHSKANLRVVLMLYCQLAEAGGIYESLKNIMGVVTLKPYLLWPFQDLVRVKKETRRVIGPNANATFRDLATNAKAIGLSRLSFLLELAFRDDVRNGISHADYVIWDDGLRLRNRNGSYADKLTFQDIGKAVTQAVGFFQILKEYSSFSRQSFNPAKEIVGRFSMNFPMSWTIFCDPENGSFRISSSSPAPVVTPAYQRQEDINARLGGEVLATYTTAPSHVAQAIDAHILEVGFEPNNVVMDEDQFDSLSGYGMNGSPAMRGVKFFSPVPGVFAGFAHPQTSTALCRSQ